MEWLGSLGTPIFVHFDVDLLMLYIGQTVRIVRRQIIISMADG